MEGLEQKEKQRLYLKVEAKGNSGILDFKEHFIGPFSTPEDQRGFIKLFLGSEKDNYIFWEALEKDVEVNKDILIVDPNSFLENNGLI